MINKKNTYGPFKLAYICLLAYTIISCTKHDDCEMIQLSDANPIHIFYDDEETFNNSVVDNIDHECYIHEHQCDEPVREQVYDEESDDEYDWVVYDENDVEIERIEMDTDSIGEDQLVPGLDSFENSGAGAEWEEGSDTPAVEIPGFGNTALFSAALNLKAGFYEITRDFEEAGGSPRVTVRFQKDGATIESFFVLSPTAGSSGTIGFYLEEDTDEIVFVGTNTDASISDVTINSYSIRRVAYVHSVEFIASDYDLCDRTLRFEVLRRSDDARFGHTDRVHFPIECENSVLILYKCNKNFAGLIYDEYSEYRYLRVKGRFFHPGKSGSAAFSEQSNGTVLTRNWVMKKKKKLEVQDCPEYMNTLIDLALAHCVDGDVTINEVSWMLADGDQYEYQGAEDRPDTYSFQPGEAWLTRKNYLKQNTL
jgi:hypothetical protein